MPKYRHTLAGALITSLCASFWMIPDLFYMRVDAVWFTQTTIVHRLLCHKPIMCQQAFYPVTNSQHLFKKNKSASPSSSPLFFPKGPSSTLYKSYFDIYYASSWLIQRGRQPLQVLADHPRAPP